MKLKKLDLNILLILLILGWGLQSQATKPLEFKAIGANELEVMITKSKNSLHIFDANTNSVRLVEGIIPGAHLLDSSENYDPVKVLPRDKKSLLVFYCANSRCTASHGAARVALRAGYTNVSVMVDGISGWKLAQKKSQPITERDLPPEPSSKGAAFVMPKAAYDSVTPKAAQDWLTQKQAVIFDIREADERTEIIPGSSWQAYSTLQNETQLREFMQKQPKDKKIIFHCASGIRSKKISEKLQTLGFSTYYFEGPAQWKRAQLPVVQGPAN